MELFLLLLFFYSSFSALRFPGVLGMSRASKKKKNKKKGFVSLPNPSHGMDLFWGEGSPTSQPAFHPKSWGEFGPGDLDFMISDIFFNINNSMMSLPVIKQEPHVEKSRIKSRRCLSRQ